MTSTVRTPATQAALLAAQRISDQRLSDARIAEALLVLSPIEHEDLELLPADQWQLGKLLDIPHELAAHLTMSHLRAAGVLPVVPVGKIRDQIARAQDLERLAAEQAQRHEGRAEQLERESIEERLGLIPDDPNDVDGEPPHVTSLVLTAASLRPADVRRAMATAVIWRRSNPEAIVSLALPTGLFKPRGETPVAERTPEQPGNDA